VTIDTIELRYSDNSTWWFWNTDRQEILLAIKKHCREFNVAVDYLKAWTIDGVVQTYPHEEAKRA